MKKVDRLRWIERTFGPEYVLPWRECRAWPEIRAAIIDLHAQIGPIGLRTDLPTGAVQGINLPFVYNVDEEKAREVWDRYGSTLAYVVCGAVTADRTMCNVLAERIGPTQFLVEWDEGGCAQRAWEHACIPLCHAWVEALDDSDGCVRGNDLAQRGWTSFVRPRMLPARTAFERIVDRLVVLPVGSEAQTVYTVRDDGRIVIW